MFEQMGIKLMHAYGECAGANRHIPMCYQCWSKMRGVTGYEDELNELVQGYRKIEKMLKNYSRRVHVTIPMSFIK